MFHRPSTRRRTAQEPVAINLVPMLDALVTLITFLLFTMSFIALVTIETPLPMVSGPQALENQKKPKPLQLTLTIRPESVEIWSPFGKTPSKTFKMTNAGMPDLDAIHQHLLKIKAQFPKERQLVLAPHGGAAYDLLVAVMDSARGILDTDPPLFAKNQQTGADEVIKDLFPDVVFGNILGDE